jgi:hypothetical protein
MFAQALFLSPLNQHFAGKKHDKLARAAYFFAPYTDSTVFDKLS